MPAAKAFTREQCDAILAAMHNPRDRCLFVLGLATGFRVSELLAVTWGDATLGGTARHTLSIGRANMKGKTASRSVPLGEKARQAIAQYIACVNAPDLNARLFPFTRQHAARILRAACSEVGLGEGYSTHSMRKTFAKRVYERLGRDLVNTQRAMGHKSVNSTVSYLAVNQEAINQAITEDI